MFACVFPRASRTPPQSFATPEALLAALTPYDQADVQGQWADEHAMLAQALTWNTPASHYETTPEVCAKTGRVIVSWVRLDNRDTLCLELNLTDAATLTDPQIILAAHDRWGAECVNRLEGCFSFVIYDPRSKQVFCARDSMGTRPFYYVLTDEVFAAATSLPVLQVLQGVTLRRSQTWTALFVANLTWDETETAFDGASKLPCAHHMSVRRDGVPAPTRYFAFDLTTTPASTRDPIWVERYRDAFDRAVRDSARSDYLVGAESSAGLDSSSIVASLVDVLPHRREDFHCFGMSLMTHEPGLLLATSAACEVAHTHVLTRPRMLDLDETFDRAVRIIGHPPEHGQMLLHPSFFDLSAHLGLRTMVSGFGGDEIVTGHGRELYDELLAARAYGTLYRELPGNAIRRTDRLARRIWRASDDPFAKARDAVRFKLNNSCLRRDVIEDLGLRDRVEGWVHPDRVQPEMNALTALSPGFTRGRITRLESASLFAASYKMDYRWPMLDRRLIQQFLATPSVEKRHRDMGRYLHRRAMVGRVPDRILWQKTKNMGAHLGGRPRTADRTLIPWSELPEALLGLLDQTRYGDMQSRAQVNDRATGDYDLRAVFNLWQSDQLVAWLGG